MITSYVVTLLIIGQVFASDGRDKFAKLSAHAKGFLTRLLMKTDKVQGLVKTVKVRNFLETFSVKL